MDVTDLLQLQRTFEGRREIVSATEVQEILRTFEFLGERFDFRSAVENLFYLSG